MREWEKAQAEVSQTNLQEEENELLRADHLTNPLLNKKLQAILDDEQSDIATRQLLLNIIHITNIHHKRISKDGYLQTNREHRDSRGVRGYAK